MGGVLGFGVITLFFYFAIAIGAGRPAFAGECRTLDFVPVRPLGHSATKGCDAEADKQACQVNKGYGHFAKATVDGHEAYRITRDQPLVVDQVHYIDSLESSPTIVEMNELRIMAREMA